jgi:hypothetical protein
MNALEQMRVYYQFLAPLDHILWTSSTEPAWIRATAAVDGFLLETTSGKRTAPLRPEVASSNHVSSLREWPLPPVFIDNLLNSLNTQPSLRYGQADPIPVLPNFLAPEFVPA